MITSRLGRRLRSAVRRPARKLLTPGPPTVELLHPVGPQVPDDRHVQQVLDLCIRIGEVLLSSGEGSGETTETMLRVADAFGLAAVDVDITFTAITICCHRGMAATPITSMRLVTHRGLDLTLLAKVYRLVEQIERGRGLRPSAAALDEAVAAAHPYPRWVATTGAAGLAGALALLLGSPWVAVLAAAVITAVIDVTGRFLAKRPAAGVLPAGRRRVPGHRSDGGAVQGRGAAGGDATGAGRRGGHHRAACPDSPWSGTVQDAIGGYNVTAAGRAAEIGVLSAGLLTGVVLGLKVAQRAGVTLDVAAELPPSGARIAVTIVGAALASGFYALNGYSPLLALLFAALAGAAGRGTYVLRHDGRRGAGGGRGGGRDGRRPGRGAAAPGRARAVGEGSAAGGHAGRDQPAAAGADRLPRLLPAVGRGPHGRPGHDHPGAGDRAGARRGRHARAVPHPAAGDPAVARRTRCRATTALADPSDTA